MRRRPRWSHVVIALALIAALAIAVPAFGIDKSLKKAIKQEVAKQLAGKTGPAGKDGAKGLDGTARAYAMVGVNCPANNCAFNRSKGVTSVTRQQTGEYCVTVPGISSANTPAFTSVNWSSTAGPEGNATAMFSADINATGCSAPAFSVITERSSSVADASPANDVAFVILIP